MALYPLLTRVRILPALLLLMITVSTSIQAANSYSPDDVFAGVEYSNRLADKILRHEKLSADNLPNAREFDARPMHVYELQVSVLTELYNFALLKKRSPPPVVHSTPISYSPTSVYYATRQVMNYLEEVYRDVVGYVDISVDKVSGKQPADVYAELLKLYYKLQLLNGKEKVSPNEVYSHVVRARNDLQSILLTLSRRLDSGKESQKRMLITAKYGMHPDGGEMPPFESGKSPRDVFVKALTVRQQLNQLRRRNQLPEISAPDVSQYEKILPIDVFAQMQFIIAEINLLKMPLKVVSTTPTPEIFSDKSPSDVYHQMQHIQYMLDRLTTVNL